MDQLCYLRLIIDTILTSFKIPRIMPSFMQLMSFGYLLIYENNSKTLGSHNVF